MTKQQAEELWAQCNVAYEPPSVRAIRRAEARRAFNFTVDIDDQILQDVANRVAAIPADADLHREDEWVRLLTEEQKND